MPCRCDGYPEPELNLHNGPVADALCKVMQEHESRGEMSCFDAPTLAWWEKHKKRDLARVQRDIEKAIRKNQKAEALAKLTLFERQLLGLN